MTRSFNNIEEAKGYFKTYNFSNWLTDTFEIKIKENGIENIYFSLQGGIATIRETNKLGWSHHIGTYGVENADNLICVLRNAVTDLYN